MATTRLGVGLLLLLLHQLTALGQPAIPYVSSYNYAPPAGTTAFYASTTAATTPAVVLNTTGFVGTTWGILGGSILGGNNASFMFPTAYPVTALFNTSATQMIAIANTTIYAFNGVSPAWNFTQPGYQFDFAASMNGQYPTPLWWNNTLFIGTRNLRSATGNSTIFAINLATGLPTWQQTAIPATYTNYPIQLGSDLQTLIVRGTNPSTSSVLYLLSGATGTLASFTYTSEHSSSYSTNWFPQFSLYNGTLWVSESGGYTYVANVSTGTTQQLNDVPSYSNGFSPIMIGNVVYVVASSTVYSFGAWNFSTLSSSSTYNTIGTLQQVVPYGATKYIFCGPYGLQTYDTTQQAFLISSNGGYSQWFVQSASDCEGLSWAPNGLLVANFGSNVYGINVTSGNISWQTYGAGALGTVAAVPTSNGLIYTVGSTASVSNYGTAMTYYNALTSWQQPSGMGWFTSSALDPSSLTFIGAPYNVVVVQSYSNNAVTVIGAFNGSITTQYSVTVGSYDSKPVAVGGFACANSNSYGYVYCVPIVQGKTSFKATYAGYSSAYTFTVSGSILYRTSTYFSSTTQIESLDTSAATPSFTTISLPSTLSSVYNLEGPVFVGSNALGQTVLYGATEDGIFGINTAATASTWAVSTSSISITGSSSVSGAIFYTQVVQVPGDNNVLVGGYQAPTVNIVTGKITGGGYGVFKFGASLGSFVAFYTFPSVQEDPVELLADTNVVLIIGTYNLTACDQNGNLYWTRSFSSAGTIYAVNLQLSAGAVFVTTYGTNGTFLYTLNAYTGAVAWMAPTTSSTYYSRSLQTSTQWASSGTPAFAVNGLVFFGGTTVYAANIVTGAFVAGFSMGSGTGYSVGIGAGNSSGAIWAFGGSYGSNLFGVPINASFAPPASAQSFSGSFAPTETLGEALENNKLWIIAVVVAFLVIVIIVAVVVSRKKGPSKEQDYVAMTSQAGSV